MAVTVLSGSRLPRVARPGVFLVALVVGFATFGAGCADRSASPVDGEGTEPLGYGKEVTVPISAAVTTLVSPGDEPRDLLRPRYAAGTTQEVTLRTDYRIQQQVNDQPARDFSPAALTIPMTATAGADGVDLTVGTVTTPDPALNKAFTTADGSHAGLEMSDLGAITELRLAPSPDTPNTARAALEQAFYQAVYRSIAFPDEPVGVGAVWTVHQEITGGVTLDQITTATLTSRDGDRLTIDLQVTQTPTDKVWELPNDAGALDIAGYVMEGTGTITVDLGLPLPVAGAIDVGGQQIYRDERSVSTLVQTQSTRVSWTE
ncbi:hypothetical protein [Nocardia asteroides]|uniref:hypothetical protein n=1 Tax=Nocardia asteroides TaxID=1824 RepID=UPI0004C19376|nr:hypothetical protein [Nocardia asteroides]UGT46649.1 hypothetical protein LT345_19060 [Nocardia asteroides]SFN88356.1 hypothetical protein SAMN05444423_1197 [Nocardia asteroides]VEG34515.1 Uncharacterised protein [Nocardia asteroides]